jgi:hypothetical protein
MQKILVLIFLFTAQTAFSQVKNAPTTIYIDPIHPIVEDPICPYDFISYFAKHFYYSGPECSGKIFVQFIINKKGKADSIKILRSLCEPVDNEVIKLIKNMPPWKPVIINGKYQPVKYALPITICPQ